MNDLARVGTLLLAIGFLLRARGGWAGGGWGAVIDATLGFVALALFLLLP